jgi:O-antigen/teichoic acid export membrane protein
MKRFFKNIFGDVLLKQSALIFTSGMFVNVTNLVFWLYMVRKLSAQDYGVLNSLIALLMLFCVPLNVLQTVVVRYISKFMAHDKKEEARALLLYFAKPLGIFVGVVFVVFILFAHKIAAFLLLERSGLIVLIGFGIAFSSTSILTLGTLVGLQEFNAIALNSALTGVAKLGIGFSLVALGCKVLGAFLGFILSFVMTFVVSLFQLPAWLKASRHKPVAISFDRKEVQRYFLPVGLTTLCFFVLTNIDVILVKHFFSATEAGYYSVAQMVGKMVLFVPGAVGIVMFPKVVATHAKNEDTRFLLYRCLWAVGILCGCVTLGALFFPDLILKTLTGHVYPQAAALVDFFALSMTFFALDNILMLYHLSLHNMKYIILMCCAAVLQVVVIWFVHATLAQVLGILFVNSVFLFVTGCVLTRKGAA